MTGILAAMQIEMALLAERLENAEPFPALSF